MTPDLLTQTAYYMSIRGKVIRRRPPTAIPLGERSSQIELLHGALSDLSRALGIRLDPPVLDHNYQHQAPPAIILACLTNLATEVLITYHMTGLSDALPRGLQMKTSLPTNETPNYFVIVDETYNEEDTDQIHTG